MSWLDKIQKELVITTGDGKKYSPQWLNATKEKEYNVAQFEFPNVSGTLVYRSKPKGIKYQLEIYFQGDNHLDNSLAFETSADDPRPWVLSHPLYGALTVQPLSLFTDNTQMNVSKITIPLVETITDQYPKGTTNPVAEVTNGATAARATAASYYGSNAKPTPADVNRQQTYVAAVYSAANPFVTPDVAADLFNAYNLALSKVADAASEPLEAAEAMQDLIALPALFETTTQQRLTILAGSFNSMRSGVQLSTTSGSAMPRAQKMAYMGNNGSVLTAMAQSAATPQDGDYTKRTDVLGVIDTMVEYYNQYIADLDFLQTATGGTPDSFVPDAAFLMELEFLINYTISNLFAIALGAKQERSFILMQDSNWLLLTHKLYGLQPDDSTLLRLIKENNASLSTMLQVPKNRRIYYYV